MTDTARTDFKRFAVEMAEQGSEVEWRVVPAADFDWHDRFIVGRNQAWNVPPTNTLLKGDYSDVARTPTRPPFDRWWQTGAPLAT